MNKPIPPDTPTRVVELRRYTLHPGRRDDLIELFEREFVETQEAVGLQVLATFIDPARPDTFVWLRGFAGMAERLQGLQAFYGGPVWQRHRDAANATMIDSDDVLLLRPITPWRLRTQRPMASGTCWCARCGNRPTRTCVPRCAATAASGSTANPARTIFLACRCAAARGCWAWRPSHPHCRLNCGPACRNPPSGWR